MIFPVLESQAWRQKNTKFGSMLDGGITPGRVDSVGGTGDRGIFLDSLISLFLARNLKKKYWLIE